MRAGTCIVASSVIAAALGALTLFNGPSVITAPTDVFVLIGGAWRMTLGQIPHVDFSNPIGALTYALIEAGMAVGGVESLGLHWAALLVLAVTAVWASLVAYSRLEPWLACAFVVFIALLCVATRPLGYDPANHSYAMLYNRIGWILLSILTIQAFIAPRNATPRQELLDAGSIGLLIGLQFYAKATFAIFGAAAFALALLLRPGLRGLPQVSAAILGAVAVGIAFWMATGVEPGAYLGDLAAAGEAQSPGARVTALRRAIVHGLPALTALSLVWLALVGRRIWADRAIRADAAAVTLQFAFLCGAGLALTTLNAGEHGEVPLYLVAGMVLLHNRELAPMRRFRRWAFAGAGVVALSIALLIGGRDALSVADTTVWRAYRVAQAPAAQRMDAPRLRDFVVPHTAAHRTQIWRAAALPARVNEGLALLREHVDGGSRVMVFALSDPFSFPLGLSPPRGAPLWWDRNFNYNLEIHPPAARVFSEVSLIMIPQVTPQDDGCCQHVITDLDAIYGAYVSEHFVEIDRSESWILLARK